MKNKEIVCIVVPCYKEVLNDFDKKSIVNTAIVFKNRVKFILAPTKLKTFTYYNKLVELGYKFKFIDDKWFESIETYNSLCLSEFLYDLFIDFEFMLIAQTDTWAFSDDLDYWCSKKQSYIGGSFCYGCPADGNVQKCKEIHSAKKIFRSRRVFIKKTIRF